jgi:RNA polymerase sigma-70 factor (ECF subfamily)
MLRAAMRLHKGDVSAAEDLVQATSLRAWRYRDSYAPGTNARAWLNTIMRRAFLSSLVVKRELLDGFGTNGTNDDGGSFVRERLDEMQAAIEVHVEPEDRIDSERAHAAAAAAIESALDIMPATFAETWIAFERQGMSYAEIAKQTGVAMGTVMSRLHRARAQIEAEFCRQSAAA